VTTAADAVERDEIDLDRLVHVLLMLADDLQLESPAGGATGEPEQPISDGDAA
jgi:hypothetical protein